MAESQSARKSLKSRNSAIRRACLTLDVPILNLQLQPPCLQLGAILWICQIYKRPAEGIVARGKNPSQKTLRIDIDVELDRAVPFRRRGEPVAHIGREVESARRADQQTQPMPSA